MTDSYTKVTHTSYFSRIKNSIIGFFIGILLIIGAIFLLWYNEQRFIDTKNWLKQWEKIVVSVTTSEINESYNNSLIHTSERAEAGGNLVDPDFWVTTEALKLQRIVEVYQWEEHVDTKATDNLGWSETQETTYSYTTWWSEGKIDSNNFAYKDGHQNPVSWQYNNLLLEKENIRLWDIQLGGEFTAQIDRKSRVDLTQQSIDLKSVNGTLAPGDNMIYIGKKKQTPEVGDTRISFSEIRPATVTVVWKYENNSLSTYTTKNGTDISLLEYWALTSDEMFQKAHSVNTLILWMLRGLGVLMIYIWFSSMLQVVVILAKVIPFVSKIIGFGTGIISFLLAITVWWTTIAIAWIYARPLIWILLLIATAWIVGGIMYLKKEKKSTITKKNNI